MSVKAVKEKAIKPKAKETKPKTVKVPNRMMLFAAEYIIDFNGTRAAQRAGMKGNDASLATQASKLLRNDKVVAEIERLTENATSRRNQIKARVIASLEEIAFDPNAIDVREDREGNILSVSRTDRIAALKLLGQHTGAFTEKIEVTGIDNMPGIVILPDKMTTEDWEKKYGHD